jgi:hypothetical protein|mmetsp:Transcript_32345/g.68028  ORF Transcript_32345/g.68028 Transcript_32345/m.68028 type:complete len:122 (-) Transcript_32345:14-379(-)
MLLKKEREAKSVAVLHTPGHIAQPNPIFLPLYLILQSPHLQDIILRKQGSTPLYQKVASRSITSACERGTRSEIPIQLQPNVIDSNPPKQKPNTISYLFLPLLIYTHMTISKIYSAETAYL